MEDGEELTPEEEELAAQFSEINFTASDAALDWAEGLEMSPETLKIYNDAMKVVYEKSWHLANYVKSLFTRKTTRICNRKTRATVPITYKENCQH